MAKKLKKQKGVSKKQQQKSREKPAEMSNGTVSNSKRGRGKSKKSSNYDDDKEIAQLQAEMREMGLYCKDIMGDGNCLFRALSDQFYGSATKHAEIRKAVCDYMEKNHEHFENFALLDEDSTSIEDFDDYIARMRKPGTFGGHAEIVAFSRAFDVCVFVHEVGNILEFRANTDPDNPHEGGVRTTSLRILRIAFFRESVHYTSARRLDGVEPGKEKVMPTAANNAPTEQENMIMKITRNNDLARVRELMSKHGDDVDEVINTCFERNYADTASGEESRGLSTNGENGLPSPDVSPNNASSYKKPSSVSRVDCDESLSMQTPNASWRNSLSEPDCQQSQAVSSAEPVGSEAEVVSMKTKKLTERQSLAESDLSSDASRKPVSPRRGPTLAPDTPGDGCESSPAQLPNMSRSSSQCNSLSEPNHHSSRSSSRRNSLNEPDRDQSQERCSTEPVGSEKVITSKKNKKPKKLTRRQKKAALAERNRAERHREMEEARLEEHGEIGVVPKGVRLLTFV